MSTVPASTTASTVIGYARVSTVGQTLEQQTEALTAAGAGKIFHDVMSGARDDRPGFTECMRYVREGDTLIVWRLDRLGRNMRGIINTLHELTQRGVTVRSLHDGVDTSTSTGRMVAGILMSIAEYERSWSGSAPPSNWTTPAGLAGSSVAPASSMPRRPRWPGG